MLLELKTISNEMLVTRLKTLVMNERKILTDILWHLDEVETRKIHLIEGYPSVFEYCVQVLGYASSQAYRRISAMRLLREVPQMEAFLNSGKLNLTHLTLAQEYFREEKKNGSPIPEAEKLELLSSLENKTTREAEKIMHTLSPVLVLKEKERVITDELTEIRFIANDILLQKLKRFKEIDSHVQVNPNYAELFLRLVDLALRQKDPKLKQKRTKKSEYTKKRETVILKGAESGARVENPRFIPAHVKEAVIKRDQEACTYPNPKTGKSCGSRFQIQFDHVVPVAKGGKSTLDGLRILCSAHNRLEAERVFGKEKMKEFLKY